MDRLADGHIWPALLRLLILWKQRFGLQVNTQIRGSIDAALKAHHPLISGGLAITQVKEPFLYPCCKATLRSIEKVCGGGAHPRRWVTVMMPGRTARRAENFPLKGAHIHGTRQSRPAYHRRRKGGDRTARNKHIACGQKTNTPVAATPDSAHRKPLRLRLPNSDETFPAESSRGFDRKNHHRLNHSIKSRV